MEGNGVVGEYIGGYSDWLRQRPAPSAPAVVARPAREAQAPPAPAQAPGTRTPSYTDQRELEQLAARTEHLETRVAALTEARTAPAFYPRDGVAIPADGAELAAVQA